MLVREAKDHVKNVARAVLYDEIEQALKRAARRMIHAGVVQHGGVGQAVIRTYDFRMDEEVERLVDDVLSATNLLEIKGGGNEVHEG